MTLSANPYNGYHFVQWSDSVTDNPRNVTVTQDSAFTAIFAPYSYMVSVYSADTTKGKVTYIHGQYDYGTYLRLTATPLEGYAFKGWSDESKAYLCQTDSVTRNYYVRGDAEVYGYFVEADSIVSDSCGANLIWELNCDGLLTFRGSGAMYNYSSSTHPWLPYERSIRDISFVGYITTIGNYAFYNMDLKDSLFIPSSVTEIGNRAFYNNNDLTYVSIPNANIGEFAFQDSRSLQSAVIGNGVYTIGRNAFKSCRKLTTLQLGASLSSIEKDAFRYCDSLRTIICYATTPPALPSGSSRSFDDNKSRITLYVPAESIESYRNAEEWSEFTNILSIEGGGEPMPPCPLASGYCGAGEDSTALRWEMGCNHTLVIEGSGAMEDYMDSLQVPWFDYRYNEIRKIQLSDSITRIGNLAFHNCWTIEELALPQRLQSIGEYAISYCTQLKQIEIPSSVTTIDDQAFYGCETLRTVTNYATTPQAISQYVFDYRVRTYGTLYVPKGSVELYRAAEGWKDFTNIQPIKCIIASGSCGAQGSNLTWEISCDSILTISGTGEMANWTRERETPWYNDNSALGPKGFLPFHSVVIEEGVTSVGNYAFRYDTSLVSLSLPKSMRKIGEYAFRKAKIKTLTIPENVDTIGQSAFYDCAQIASVTCLATTPPTNAREARFFTNTYNFELHVPCGTAQAYSAAQVWRYWTPTEGIYDYSVGDAEILTMPACLNNSTLRFQARDLAGRRVGVDRRPVSEVLTVLDRVRFPLRRRVHDRRYGVGTVDGKFGKRRRSDLLRARKRDIERRIFRIGVSGRGNLRAEVISRAGSQPGNPLASGRSKRFGRRGREIRALTVFQDVRRRVLNRLKLNLDGDFRRGDDRRVRLRKPFGRRRNRRALNFGVVRIGVSGRRRFHAEVVSYAWRQIGNLVFAGLADLRRIRAERGIRSVFDLPGRDVFGARYRQKGVRFVDANLDERRVKPSFNRGRRRGANRTDVIFRAGRHDSQIISQIGFGRNVSIGRSAVNRDAVFPEVGARRAVPLERRRREILSEFKRKSRARARIVRAGKRSGFQRDRSCGIRRPVGERRHVSCSVDRTFDAGDIAWRIEERDGIVDQERAVKIGNTAVELPGRVIANHAFGNVKESFVIDAPADNFGAVLNDRRFRQLQFRVLDIYAAPRFRRVTDEANVCRFGKVLAVGKIERAAVFGVIVGKYDRVERTVRRHENGATVSVRAIADELAVRNGQHVF